ncbi:unnamed protein product [Rangifer tarandus platyrhynchus]|uniref:Uncharacterized protein n=1 Tax=Rangifer tarandus platyrhynchus TaxID=3082113 RepID=A0AC59Z0S6_RANTA
MWRPGGGAGAAPGLGARRFLSFPGVQGSFCGRFYLRSQTKFAAAFPRSAPARVKRSGRRPAESRPIGLEPRSVEWRRRGEGGEIASHVTLGGKGGAESHPLGAPLQLLPALPQPYIPEVPAVPSGGWCQKRRWTSWDGTPWSEPPGTRATPTLHNKGLPEGCA